MAGYTRNDITDNIATGNTIRAADLDGEYDAVESAFNATTGHTHDGTAAEGGPVSVIGPAQDTVATSTALRPKTDNTYDLGTPVYEWKDLYIDGTAYIDNLQADSVTMSGGTLDNVVIGGTTPAAADFTTVTIQSAGIDGGSIDGTVIGGVTPANGTFDDLNVDGNLIVNGGADISPSAHLLPTTDNAYDLGSSSFEFRDLYIDGIAYVDDLRADTVDIDGGTIDGVTIATGTFSGSLTGVTVNSLSAPLAVTYGGTGTNSIAGIQSALNLGTMAYQNVGSVSITGGSISGVTISGYATTSWVEAQNYATESYVTTRGYITSSALNGYATETYVTTRGYVTSSSLGSMAYESSGTYATVASLGSMAYESSGTYATVASLGSAAYADTGDFVSSSGGGLTVDYVDAGGGVSGAGSRSSAYSGWFGPTANSSGYAYFRLESGSASGTAPRMYLQKNNTSNDTTDAAIYFGDNSDADKGAIKYEFDNNRLVIRGEANDQIYVDNTGVGINTSVSYTLDVGGSARVDDNFYATNLYTTGTGSVIAGDTISSVSDNSVQGCRMHGGSGWIAVTRADNCPMYVHRTGGNWGSISISNEVMRIYGDGSQMASLESNIHGTGFATTSDYRVKKDVTPITSGWERVKNLKPCSFRRTDVKSDDLVEGFIAHELEEVVPMAVSGKKDAVDEDGNLKLQKVKKEELIPLLAAGLKDAILKIEELERKIGELENGPA